MPDAVLRKYLTGFNRPSTCDSINTVFPLYVISYNIIRLGNIFQHRIAMA